MLKWNNTIISSFRIAIVLIFTELPFSFIYIALQGSGIAQEHCDLQVTQERVILHSIGGATYINNQLIVVAQDKELRQGDVLQFGDFLKFRFHNPMEAAALREKRRSGGKFMQHSMLDLSSGASNGRLPPAVSFLCIFIYFTIFCLQRSPRPLSENFYSYARNVSLTSKTVSLKYF